MEELKPYDQHISTPAKVEEALAAYGSFGLPQLFNDKLSTIQAIRKGVSIALFDTLKKYIPLTDVQWADFLGISPKSLQRYKNDTDFVFKRLQSEKIIELAEVSKLGLTVFDSKEQFYSWLDTPSFALGSNKPIELIKDSYGKELVMNELHRIDHGVFS